MALAGDRCRSSAATHRAWRERCAADPQPRPAVGARTDRARSRLRQRTRSRRRDLCAAHPARRHRRHRTIARYRARRRRSSTGSDRTAFARRCRARSSMRGAARSSCGARIVASRPSRALAAGDIWDGRFRIGALPAGATIAAFGPAECRGDAGQRRVGCSPSGRGAGELARAALAVEPALWRDGICQGLATDAPAWRGESSRPGRASCRPSILQPARAVATLLGADIPPEPPFAGHKERKG